MKVFLVWLIVTVGADGGIESRLYETRMTSTTACYIAQDELDAKLLAEGYTNFTTSCEIR